LNSNSPESPFIYFINPKYIIMRKKLFNSGLTALVICLISMVLFFVGCQSEREIFDDDPAIVTSTELEDYIIAATDLQQSLKTFRNELDKINFANLETVIENGRKVIYLPASIRSLKLEEKILSMNQKKILLLNKYPEIASLGLENFSEKIDDCIKQSMRVNDFLLEKNINFHQPLTRAVVGEYSFDSINAVAGYLYNWMLSPDYVEVVILTFTDGTLSRFG
jgi:hypothetical protein